jgi:DNA processing protein
MKDDLKFWLALTFIKDVGPISIKKLLSIFRSPENIFNASLKDLLNIPDIGEIRAKNIYEFSLWDRVDREISAIKERNIKIIKYTDNEYPETLRQIEDSPILIYCYGEFLDDDKYSIAIVGSRNMTEYGLMVTDKLSYELASLGITIVSGMARGIDSVAHKGALKAKGRSIAVLGSGIDKPYPFENRSIFNKLSRSGAVISEFPLGTPPNKENFPRRNRLISGLSLGVVVVEATINSGSLITADYAIEQGKEVFAVPGNIFSKHSEGTNLLIKRGAKLVHKIDDILEELEPKLKKFIASKRNPNMKNLILKDIDALEISSEEKAICNILGLEAKHIDNISRELNIPVSRLLGILLSLEMKGIIMQLDGMRFCLKYC